MKKIKLFNQKNKTIFALVDDCDFEKLNKYRWYCTSNGYVARTDYFRKKKIAILMHRQLLNAPIKFEVDHCNGNTLDNQKSNLRLATHAENIRNRTHLNKNNLSGVTGVCWFKLREKWRARLMINRKEIHLGLFVDKKDAIGARDQAAKMYFGEFARLNQIEGNF